MRIEESFAFFFQSQAWTNHLILFLMVSRQKRPLHKAYESIAWDRCFLSSHIFLPRVKNSHPLCFGFHKMYVINTLQLGLQRRRLMGPRILKPIGLWTRCNIECKKIQLLEGGSRTPSWGKSFPYTNLQVVPDRISKWGRQFAKWRLLFIHKSFILEFSWINYMLTPQGSLDPLWYPGFNGNIHAIH